MKINEHSKLSDIIAAAIDELRASGGSLNPSAVVDHILNQHGEELAAHSDQLMKEGLYQRCRQVVKRRCPEEDLISPKQLSWNFGIVEAPADRYAVPINEEDLLGEKDWIAVSSMTPREADRAVASLETQAENDVRQAAILRKYVDAAVKLIGINSELTLGDASELAKEHRERKADQDA